MTKYAVTGAFGYTGKHLTKKLLDKNIEVITLTNSYKRTNPFGDKVKAFPFNFNKPNKLIESLKGTKVLFNTYWVRFNHKTFTHQQAVDNTIILFDSAKKAGVEKIVHVSITNPSEDSKLEYFSGKAILEKELINSGLQYAILRPTVIFGKEDILINNIAWMIRKFPIFGVFGDGNYKLQPIYVDDLADLAIREAESSENKIIDAIGPETFTYRELVTQIGNIIGKKRKIISISPKFAYFVASIVSKIVGDVLITKHEIEGLTNNLLCTNSAPAGTTKLTEWTKQNAEWLGKNYANELSRRKDRKKPYIEDKS